jgi:predicted TIM-barrel fold metal-dependent hydrolase
MFKLFDSLAHPTIDGFWMHGKKGVSFQDYGEILNGSSSILGSIVCGLPNIGGYQSEEYFRQASLLSTIKPVIPIAPLEDRDNIDEQFIRLKQIGYRGIKVHGRLMKQEYSSIFVRDIFSASNAYDMPIFLCTFCYAQDSTLTPRDLYGHLVENIIRWPKTKLILVHAGVHEIPLYYELARGAQNIILDLSYTLVKYRLMYSHVFKFLAHHLDRKIFIGTDYPEYDVSDVEESAKNFLSELSKDKIHNICFGNIEKYFRLT